MQINSFRFHHDFSSWPLSKQQKASSLFIKALLDCMVMAGVLLTAVLSTLIIGL